MSDLKVTVSDFPFYDGSSRPGDFLRQCRRLAALGGIPDEKLCDIVAARCKGVALEVINATEDFKGPLSLDKIRDALIARFDGAAANAQQAAEALSTLVKGSDTAAEYGHKVQRLVRKACPEFFTEEGQVKKICVPAHSATLYRHFLIGLSDHEKRLLSRLKATTFDACISELTREEALPGADRDADAVTLSARHVRWSSLERLPRPRHSGTRRNCGCCHHTDCDDDEEASSDDEGATRRRAGSCPPRPYPPSRPWRPTPSPPAATGQDRRGRPPGGAGRNYWRDGRAEDRATAAGRRRSPARGRSGSREPRPGAGSPRRRGDSGERCSSRSADWQSDQPAGGTPPATGIGRRGNIRCWSCSGFGHLKRDCPNEWRDRYTE